MSKRIVVLAAAVLFISSAACSVAAETDGLTDEDVVDVLDGGLGKVLHHFDIPNNLVPYRHGDNADDDSIWLRYDGFSVEMRQDKVICCAFTQKWPGTVKGVKIGDGRDQVVGVLGKPKSTGTYEGGTILDYSVRYHYYSVKDGNRYLDVDMEVRIDSSSNKVVQVLVLPPFKR